MFLYKSSRIFHRLTNSLKSPIAGVSDLSKRAPVAQQTPLKHSIEKAAIRPQQNVVDIAWNDGNRSRFPFVFLRDNCQCQDCFHHPTKQRKIDIVRTVQLEFASSRLSISQDGEEVQVVWPDSHVSVFKSDWLRERLFPQKETCSQRERPLVDRGTSVWGDEMNGNVPKVDFCHLMGEDAGLFEWLEYVRRYGVAVVTNVPTEFGQVPLLGQRVGLLKKTLYGPTSRVECKRQPFNLAFTNADFGCHTDMSFYEQTGGVEMFHCIAQVAAGGETILVDGFNVVTLLRDADYEAFDTLCNVLLPYHEENNHADEFQEFHHHNWTAPIQLDPYGKIKRFCFNESSRDSFLHIPVDEVAKFYDAYAKLTQLIQDEHNRIEYKMIPGEIITVNNLRVMHGRTGFEMKDGERRLLEVGFVDWDVAYSKMRIMAKRLGLTGRYGSPYIRFDVPSQ